MNQNIDLARWFRPENFLLLLFLGLLAWAPFPYGSNRPWAELALGLGLGAILMCWAGVALSGFAAVTSLARQLVLPGACVGMALGWALFQSIDLVELDRLTGLTLRPLAHPVWALSGAALGKDIGAYISVDPEKTREAVFAAGLSVASFLIAFGLARERERASLLFSGIVVLSLAYAVVAIASFYLHIDFQAWLMPDARADYGRVSGPFINPNHFATFLALGTLAALGIFVETLRQSIIWDRGWRLVVRSGIHTLTGPSALHLVAIVIMLSALLLTQSRAGVIAFLAGTLALTFMLSFGRDLSQGEASGRRAIVAVLVAVLGTSLAVSADPLLNRVQTYGLNDTTRTSLADSALKAIQTAPLVGHGFGAFQRYYPIFADGSVRGDVDEAHNDVLETLADLGLPAGLTYVAGPVLLASMCFAGCFRRRRDRVFPAVALAASVVVGLHSFADFGLQIPAVAVTYAALLGTGVAQSWRTNMDLVR